MQPADEHDAESERGSDAGHDDGTAASVLHDVSRKEGAEQAAAGRRASITRIDE